ncbi:hypothetical protein ACFOGJ_24215 [Marinibaculum pumilum]|uniref:Uncharacterized protein n=1 Tax=Marinibaculum pumilum TaxID=1766165 RepID=A0ABV7L7J5_9PROT
MRAVGLWTLALRILVWMAMPLCLILAVVLAAFAAAPVRAEESTTLVLSQGAPAASAQTVQATLGDLVSDPRMAGVDVAKLVVRGMASPQSGNNGTEVNVQWYSVARLDGARELPLGSPLRSRFLVRAANVPAATRVAAYGDVNGLIVQARALLAPEGNTPSQDSGLGAALTRLERAEEEDRKRDGSSSGKGNLAGGGGEGQNPIAAAYEPLPPVEKSEERAADPTEPPDYAVTTDGCGVRIDLVQGVAVVQSRETANGKPVTDCTDSFDRFPLQRDYAVCPATLSATTATLHYKLYYEIDGRRVYVTECTPDPNRAAEMQKVWDACSEAVVGEVAYRRYRLAFVNGKGEREFATDCTVDRSEPLSTARKYDGCQPEFDLAAETFRRAYQLVYTSPAGEERAIGGCRTTDSETQPLSRTWSGCSEIIDRTTNTVRRGYQLVYADTSGATREIGTCRADDSPAGEVRTDKDYSACEPIIDIDGGAVTLAYKESYLDGTGTIKALGGCNPDPTTKRPLDRDFASCAEKVDAATGTVTRQYKYLYADNKGAVRTVGDCRPDIGNVLQVQSDYSVCTPEIDAIAGVRRDQARAYYTKADGTKTWLGECKPTDTPPVPLSKSYEGCAELVDMAAQTVRRQYRPSYTGRDGTVVKVGDCRPDPEPSGEIVVQLDHATCDPVIDGAAGTRKGQVRAYFASPSKGKTWIGECQPGDAPPEPMTKAHDACPELVDEVALSARRQFQWSYIARSGSVVRVGSCRPDPDPSAEVLVRQDYEACGPLVDGVEGTKRRQFQPFFTSVKGEKTTIGGCIPGDNPADPMDRTTEGCSLHVDAAGGVVRTRYRFTYKDRENKAQYAGDCRIDVTADGLVPLERNFGSCDPVVDNDAVKVWPAYKLGYRLADGSLKTFGECVTDTDQLVPLLRNYADCEVRVDSAGNKVFPSHRKFFVQDGAEQPVGDCTEDPEDGVELQKGFGSCTDKVNVSSMSAWPQYKRFFIDRKGSSQYVDAECRPDTDTRYEIKFDEKNCTPFVNLAVREVAQRVELVYRDGEDRRVVVEGCGTHEGTATWDVIYETAPCSLTHDMRAGRSIQEHRPAYNRDGTVWPLGTCETSDLVYSHQQTEQGCALYVDQAGGFAMRQSRTIIVTPSGTVEVAACEPIEGSKQGLQKTWEACQGRYRHDMAAGVSYVFTHWYHTLAGGRTWVTPCEEDRSTSYPHQTVHVSWDQDDAARMSTEFLWMYVDMPPHLGRLPLAGPGILPTSAKVPYTYNRTTTRPTDQFSVDGCQRYQLTEKWETYNRKDGSEAHYLIGPGEPIPQGGECGRQTERREVWQTAVATFSTANERMLVAVNACNGGDCIPFVPWGPRGDQTWTWASQGNLPGPYQLCRIFVPSHIGSRPQCANVMKVQSRQKVTQASGAVTYTDWVDTGETRQASMPLDVQVDYGGNAGHQ